MQRMSVYPNCPNNVGAYALSEFAKGGCEFASDMKLHVVMYNLLKYTLSKKVDVQVKPFVAKILSRTVLN